MDCFLGTYDIAVARAKQRALEGWQQERGWANRVHRSFAAFLEDAHRNLKATRLVLIEGMGLGAVSRERMLNAALAFERILAAGFRVAPDGVQLPPLAPRMIVGGCRYVMLERLLEGREGELPGFTDELLDWVSSYRSSAAPTGVIRIPSLSPVPARPARFLKGEDKRAGLLGALAQLTLEEGYAELTDPQIAQSAGVTTESFHKQFPSKRECLLALIDEFVDETLETVAAAAALEGSWPEAVHAGIEAGLVHLASRPGLTRIAWIDAFDLGSAVIESISRSVQRVSNLLTQTAPDPQRAPVIAHEVIAGGVWEVVLTYATPSRVQRLPSLTDHVAFMVLAPYVGPKAAAQTIEAMKEQ